MHLSDLTALPSLFPLVFYGDSPETPVERSGDQAAALGYEAVSSCGYFMSLCSQGNTADVSISVPWLLRRNALVTLCQ